ncbi:hypothetical protein niasHS_004418 [Heterodera schachtii]|uniref:OTU domain-containing protein n=1 Tax=Heterodera schachtii TaxID=97005 RepID=A0ABD2K0N5_HETSC
MSNPPNSSPYHFLKEFRIPWQPPSRSPSPLPCPHQPPGSPTGATTPPGCVPLITWPPEDWSPEEYSSSQCMPEVLEIVQTAVEDIPRPVHEIERQTPIKETSSGLVVSPNQSLLASIVTKCYNVIGDGDCFYRAVCYSLFAIDERKNSDALRLMASKTLLTIVNNANFYPKHRHDSHADFIKDLCDAFGKGSSVSNGQALTTYARQIATPARGKQDNYSGWAKLDDAHIISIMLRRPVVIVRPIADSDFLIANGIPQWNDQSEPQTLNIYFPDGELMLKKRDIDHANLCHFTVFRRGKRNTRVERIVANPIVLWYNGVNHFQCIYFEPIQPHHRQGIELIGSDTIEVPPNFIS